MKTAVMQPYIFPYLGYFQLIHAVDNFVFYDDVNFIKGGWINRNSILVNGQRKLFTIPLDNPSSFKQIKDTDVHPQLFEIWKKKFIKSLNQSYAKAPYVKDVVVIVEEVLSSSSNMGGLAVKSVKAVSEYLGLEKNYFISSQDFSPTKGLDKVKRLVEICKVNNSSDYVNPSGGKELYNKPLFAEHNLDLYFIENRIPSYTQFGNDFVPGLSIIDVLMFNSKEKVKNMLSQYTLD